MKEIDFKTSSYFTDTVYFLGITLLPAAPLLMVVNTIIGLITGLISLVILTTHYRLKIDFDRKVYQDYLWILGFKKIDKKAKFNTIEYLFIKKNKTVKTLQNRGASSTLRQDVFDGYLKFSEDDKVYITTKLNKENLLKKLRPISVKLNVGIIDYSQEASGIVSTK